MDIYNRLFTRKGNSLRNGSKRNTENVIDLDLFDDDDIFAELEDLDGTTKNRDKTINNKALTIEKLDGFDEQFGLTYIYPTNYPVREYQFNIIKKCLFGNSLVVLPTGLGKTFIAAVVMYNFYRWYPQRKLIFMAPTKPLVAQQINACYDIMGIPHQDTAEMTGASSPIKRETMWKEKRVFFMTPQVLQNDLARGSCQPKDIVCLVFDEAHRALGSHAYSQVIKEIHGHHSQYRVLALSATPGDDMKAIQQVINNLLISNIQIRSEESIDIQKYVHNRNIQKIVVPISGQLAEVRRIFLEVLQSIVDRLSARQVLWTNDAEKLSKFTLLKSRENWRAKDSRQNQALSGCIEGEFALLMSMYHAYEVLLLHGLLSFYTFLKGVLCGRKGTTKSKMELQQNVALMDLMETLHSSIEPEDGNQSLNQSILAEAAMDPKRRLLKSIPKPMAGFVSHPKITKLEEIVVNHFQEHNRDGKNNTRIMIFSQYRDSVQEITQVLSSHEPLVKCMSFIGQGSKDASCNNQTSSKGLSQKEQIEILARFRKGSYNTVVSTSVGEEGLDIGEVDLIICFDASNSPIRLVQRMGRTGRKRDGKIIILVGEGKEEQTYKKSLANKKSIHGKLINAASTLEMFDEAPRMIPRHLNPTCYKMNIVVEKKQDNLIAKTTSKKSSSTTTKKGSNIKQFIGKGFLSSEEKEEYNQNFRYELECLECQKLQSKPEKCPHRLTRWSQWQTSCQTFSRIPHSTRTVKFCNLMETGDLFNNPREIDKYEKKLLKSKVGVQKKSPKNLGVASKSTGKSNSAAKDFRRKLNEGKLKQGAVSDESEDDLVETKKIRTPLFSNKDVEQARKVRMSIGKLGESSTSNNLSCDSSTSTKSKKVRLTKLPKVPKIAVDDLSDIEDNQIGFCSQQTMPTLYDRCQLKRKRLSILNEDEDEGGVGDVEDEKKDPKRMRFEEEEEEKEEIENPSDSPGEEFLPITSPKLRKTPSKLTEVPEKETIPEAPFDLDLSSFHFETQLQKDDPKSVENEKLPDIHESEDDKLCHRDNSENEDDENLNRSSSENDHLDELDGEMAPDENKLGGNKSHEKELHGEMDELEMMGDSLLKLFDEADDDLFNDVPASPPIVSQINRKLQKNIGQEVKKKPHESFEANEQDSPILPNKKKKRKKLVIQETQQTPEHPPSESSDEDSEDYVNFKDFASGKKKQAAAVSRKKRCSFIEYEARDDDVTTSDVTHGDNSVVNGYIKDSFINDETIYNDDIDDSTFHNGKTPVDMRMVYKQSLMSGKKSALNFHTPAFKSNRNRFKLANLAEKYMDASSEEAEEVLGPIDSDEERLLFQNQYESRQEDENEEEVEEINKAVRRRIKPGKRIRTSTTPRRPPQHQEMSPNQPQGRKPDQPQERRREDWYQLFDEHSLPEISFNFGIVWGGEEVNTCPQKKTDAAGTPVIVINTKCLANSQIASNLRFKEGCTVVTHQRVGCDYIVSRRSGVLRKLFSEISRGSNSKLTESLKTLCNLYERPVLIIEKDRVKKDGPVANANMTKSCAKFMSKLSMSNVRILHSSNQEQTATFLCDLSRAEVNRGHVISQPKGQKKQFIESLFCVPNMTYPVAMEISKRYQGFGAIMKTSLSEWNDTLSFLPEKISSNFFFFFQKKFDLSMTSSKKL